MISLCQTAHCKYDHCPQDAGDRRGGRAAIVGARGGCFTVRPLSLAFVRCALDAPTIASELKTRHLMRRWGLMCASTWRTRAAPCGAAWNVGGHVPAHRTHPVGLRPKSQTPHRTCIANARTGILHSDSVRFPTLNRNRTAFCQAHFATIRRAQSVEQLRW